MNFEVKGCAVDIFLGVNEGKERKREGDPAPETTHHRKNLPRAGDFFEEQEIFLKNGRDDSNNS